MNVVSVTFSEAEVAAYNRLVARVSAECLAAGGLTPREIEKVKAAPELKAAHPYSLVADAVELHCLVRVVAQTDDKDHEQMGLSEAEQDVLWSLYLDARSVLPFDSAKPHEGLK